jgi:signal transduction histidine kinase
MQLLHAKDRDGANGTGIRFELGTEGTMNRAPRKILYVEDNPMNRLLVQRVLTKAGYVVIEAEDGLSGIQAAEREQPDLILMDIVLPDMDGHQVTTRLRSLPKVARIPIVALTSKIIDSARDRALIAGCDGFIPKPISVDQLPSQIAEFLEGKREEFGGDVEDRLSLQQEYTRELVLELENKVRELQKANVELCRTDELKSKFITIVSHELKTPLAVIQGHLSILQSILATPPAPIDTTGQTSLAGIERGVERLLAIVQDMLDFVRIEGQTLTVHRKPTVLKVPVTAALRRLETAAQERQININADSMEGLPIILADATRLTQVFYNLLSNAIKYTPNGGQIRIKTQVSEGIELAHYVHAKLRFDRFVHIIVEDTGIGIAPEEQERIFDLFYEVHDISRHSTSKTRFMGGGLGLGLAISQGLVEAHGGALWAESEGYDEERCPGSRFHVVLPIEHQ